MFKYFLGATALLTLILNVVLTFYIIKSKLTGNSSHSQRENTVSFVLEPKNKASEAEVATELLYTKTLREENNTR